MRSQQNTGYSVDGASPNTPSRSELCGPPAGRPGLRTSRSDPLRRRDRLQGAEGDRRQARRYGSHFRHRGTRPRRRPVCEGHGPRGNRCRYLGREAVAGTQDGRRCGGQRHRRPMRWPRWTSSAAAREACSYRRLTQSVQPGSRNAREGGHDGPHWAATGFFRAGHL